MEKQKEISSRCMDVIPKHIGVLARIKKFAINSADGTYDYETGEIVNLETGYMVTFHQNDENGNAYGRYTDEEYDLLTQKVFDEIGADKIYIGVYNSVSEVSFCCKSKDKAKMIMHTYNQESIWDNSRKVPIINLKYDKRKNPINH